MARWSKLGVAVLLGASLFNRPVAAAGGAVKLTDKQGVVVVEIDGQPFTEYHYAAEPNLPWSKPYFFPVRAPDGTEITADQARLNTKEHPHHRSLWVGQGAVNGFDHWAHAKDPKKQPEQKHLKFDKVEGDTIVEQLAWTDADGKPMLNEQRTWRFFAAEGGDRGIDLTSVYKTAENKPVTFGGTKEGGMVSVRLNKRISDTCTITLANGAVSKNNGDKGKKEKGDEANVWGKAAEWCDLSGKIGDKAYGVVVFDHPLNPRHPSTWHVRRYGLLGANIFGLHDFDKAKYPDEKAGDLKVDPGKPVTFQYRVLIHTGAAESKKLSEKYAAYVGEKK